MTEETKDYNYEAAYNLKRIADTLDTIVAMIKADQERSKKYMEENKSEQTTRYINGQDLSWPLALAPGPGTMLQGSSGKLQASSSKLDKIKL